MNKLRKTSAARYSGVLLFFAFFFPSVQAKDPFKPMSLPGGVKVVSDSSPEFLVPPDKLKGGDFTIAKTPPTIEFGFYPEQTFPGNPWSAWGDNSVVGDKWYSAVGDHKWDVFLYEYDLKSKAMRSVLNVRKFLNMPEGNYTPAKIHSRIDMGSDGWLYFTTHRGSGSYTTDKYHFKGDWLLRYHPGTEETEIVSHGPVGKESIPVSILDPDRMIFYGGTQQNYIFFAFDLKNRKLLYKSNPKEGPYRYIMWSKSTGRVYYQNVEYTDLRRYDPATNNSTVIPTKLGMRSCTLETPQGKIYTVATKKDGRLFSFDVKTEKAEEIGHVRLEGKEYKTSDYVTTLDVDHTGTYLYYCAGNAHGNSAPGGTPIVQHNVKTGEKKVICFLVPFYQNKYQFAPGGTYGSALNADSSILCITWLGHRSDIKTKYTNEKMYCGYTVIRIPESERPAR